MDMLYRAYSNPLDLMNMYINRGRFGEFVEGFLQAEFERRKAEEEKYSEWMMWTAYVHSYSGESFNQWKERVYKTGSTEKTSDNALDEAGAKAIIDNLFPG